MSDDPRLIYSTECDCIWFPPHHDDCRAVTLAELAAARAEVARLRAALEKVSELVKQWRWQELQALLAAALSGGSPSSAYSVNSEDE